MFYLLIVYLPTWIDNFIFVIFSARFRPLFLIYYILYGYVGIFNYKFVSIVLRIYYPLPVSAVLYVLIPTFYENISYFKSG